MILKGSVKDSKGNPAQDLTVNYYKVARGDHSEQLSFVGAVNTDPEGRFRIDFEDESKRFSLVLKYYDPAAQSTYFFCGQNTLGFTKYSKDTADIELETW